MRGGPRVPDSAGKEEGGSKWGPKGPGGKGEGGVGWERHRRWRRDGAQGQEGGLSAQTTQARERRQRRGVRWQDHEGEGRGTNIMHGREKSARQEVQGSKAAKERGRWGPGEVQVR